MNTVFLIRNESDNQGTYSRLICNEIGLDINAIELPDRGNMQQYSRIPKGDYLVIPYNSPKFGKCWIITGVPDRKYVLFHCGNYGGDTRLGWRTDTHGCILPGMVKGHIIYNGRRQKALFNSTSAFNEMKQRIGLTNKFLLKIIEL